MPFGKYRGEQLDELPLSYLAWLIDECELRDGDLRDALWQEWRRRTSPPAPSPRRSCPVPKMAEELIGAGLRTLARRYHPDAGGTHDQMIAVSATADWLRAQVRGLSA